MLNTTLKTIAELDPVIHHPTRLMLFFLLSRNEKMDYLMLMRSTMLSSGNISTHLNKMQEAGYIHIQKTFISKKTHTVISLSPKGKSAYQKWGESVLCAVAKESIQKQRSVAYQGFQDTYWDFNQMQGRIYKPAFYGRALPLPPMDSNLSL